jgi:hypothetical protein
MKRLLTILLVSMIVFAGGSLFFAEDAQAQLSLGLTWEADVLNDFEGLDAEGADLSPVLPAFDLKYEMGDLEAKLTYDMLRSIEFYFEHDVALGDYLDMEYNATLGLGWDAADDDVKYPLHWDFAFVLEPVFHFMILNAPIAWEFEAETKFKFAYEDGVSAFSYKDPIKLNNKLTFIDDGFIEFLVEIGTTYALDSMVLGLPMNIELNISGIADMIDLEFFVEPEFTWNVSGMYADGIPSSTIKVNVGFESDFHLVPDVLDLGLDVKFTLGEIELYPDSVTPADEDLALGLTIKFELRYYLPISFPLDGEAEAE